MQGWVDLVGLLHPEILVLIALGTPTRRRSFRRWAAGRLVGGWKAGCESSFVHLAGRGSVRSPIDRPTYARPNVYSRRLDKTTTTMMMMMMMMIQYSRLYSRPTLCVVWWCSGQHAGLASMGAHPAHHVGSGQASYFGSGARADARGAHRAESGGWVLGGDSQLNVM